MTPDRWRQIEALYQMAQNCGVTERVALLEKADPEIRSLVKRMLEQKWGNELLNPPLADLPDDAGKDESRTFLGPGSIRFKLI